MVLEDLIAQYENIPGIKYLFIDEVQNVEGFEEGHSRKIPHMAKGGRRTGHVTVEQFSAKWDINDGRTDLLWD